MTPCATSLLPPVLVFGSSVSWAHGFTRGLAANNGADKTRREAGVRGLRVEEAGGHSESPEPRRLSAPWADRSLRGVPPRGLPDNDRGRGYHGVSVQAGQHRVLHHPRRSKGPAERGECPKARRRLATGCPDLRKRRGARGRAGPASRQRGPDRTAGGAG